MRPRPVQSEEERKRRTKALAESKEASREKKEPAPVTQQKPPVHTRRIHKKKMPVLQARTLGDRMSKELVSDRTWNQAGILKNASVR